MSAIITGADLIAAAPDHTRFSDYALAKALGVPHHQISELRRQADLHRGAVEPAVADLMSACGINRHEAETYLRLQRHCAEPVQQGDHHG